MTEEKVEKVVRPIEKTLDDQISKIASAMGVSKDQVIRMAIKTLTSKEPDKLDRYMELYEKTKDLPIRNTGAGVGNIPSIQEIILYKMLGGIDKEEKSSIDLEKILSFQLLKSMFAPTPTEMMMYMNMFKDNSDKSSDKSEFFKMMLQQQQQTQNALMAAIFGKERAESIQKIAELEKKNTEQQLQAKLDFAEKVLPEIIKLQNKIELMEKSGGKSFLEEMQEYATFHRAMKEFAKEHGFVEKEDKINWAELAKQILGLGKEAVTKLPSPTPPPPRTIQPIQPKIIPEPTKNTKKTSTTKETTKEKPEETPQESFTEPLMSDIKKKK